MNRKIPPEFLYQKFRTHKSNYVIQLRNCTETVDLFDFAMIKVSRTYITFFIPLTFYELNKTEDNTVARSEFFVYVFMPILLLFLTGDSFTLFDIMLKIFEIT